MNIAVAVSGGIDSLYALITLKEAGLHPLAIHGKFLPNDTLSKDFCSLLQKLGIPLLIADLTQQFSDNVLTKTTQSFLQGKTPNPCALCNQKIKFGELVHIAKTLGCKLATGHYTSIQKNPSGYFLVPSKDSKKDQSYFLSLVPKEALEQCVFPLANKTKEECREYLLAKNLPFLLPKESRDICFFAKQGSHDSFAKTLLGTKEADVVLIEENGTTKCLNQKKDLTQVTVGQRRGLGIAASVGLYVLKKDCKNNILYLGSEKYLGMKQILARDINYFLPYKMWPNEIFVKVRFRQKAQKAKVFQEGNNLLICYDSPVFPTDIDQLVSISDTCGRILAGGLVESLALVVDDFL